MIDCSDLSLSTLELALRIKQVINRRHKEVVMHVAHQVTRESCKIAKMPLATLCHKDSQHLSRRHFIGPIDT